MTDALRLVVGDWLVLIDANRVERDGESALLSSRTMAVLVELCRHPGEVLSAEALLEACIPDPLGGDNAVHKAIATLRRVFRDSSTDPRYIETIRTRGYRLLPAVRVLSGNLSRDHRRSWRGESPFRGLEPFDQAHASVFFGRDAAIGELQAQLAIQRARGYPLVVLLGPSGSGKTSLVQAGLVPALLADAGAPEPQLSASTVATVDLGTLSELGPWVALAGGLLDWELDDAPLLSGHSIESLTRALREAPGEIERLLRIGVAAGRSTGLPLLVLDRLESLFLLPDPGEAVAFIQVIEQLVSTGIVLTVAVCRNDFYPALAQHPPFMRDKQHGAHMDLAPPDAESIAQMIRLPAQAADLVFGLDKSGLNRLDDRLCADAQQARDALPLLQYALRELYLRREPGGELTWAAYEALGGLEGAVGRRAEALLAQLPQAQQDALPRLLPRLISLASEDAHPTSRWVASRLITDADESALVHALVQARLLVADQVGGVPGVRVAHEALLRAWPRVTPWIAQHRALLSLREELHPWAQRWNDGGRQAALLLPNGAMLWRMGTATAESPQVFSHEELAYVARSQARVQRMVRWRWAGTVGVIALAVVALGAAIRSTELARVASARELESQQLASFMLGDLADQLRPVGKLDLLVSLGERGLRVLRAEADGDASPNHRLQRAKALVVIGETQGSRGKGRTDLAIEALDQALQLLQPLEGAPGLDIGDHYKTLGAAHFWRGQIAFDKGDFDRAAVEMGRYRDTCERWLAIKPEDPVGRAEMGFALSSLGSIAVRRGAWIEADRWFEASLKLKLAALAAKPGDSDALDAVANSRTWLAIAARARGQARQALDLLDEALATSRAQVASHPDEISRIHDLGTLQMRRAEAQRDLGQFANAERTLAEAVALIDRASDHDPGNAHWQTERPLVFATWQLARLDAGLPINDGAFLLKSRLEQVPASVNAKNLTLLQARASQSLLHTTLAVQRKDWAAAVMSSSEGHLLMETLHEIRPRYWQSRELQARAILVRLGIPEAAKARIAYCEGAARSLKPIVEGGQVGVVQTAWEAARRCDGIDDPDEAGMRLTALK